VFGPEGDARVAAAAGDDATADFEAREEFADAAHHGVLPGLVEEFGGDG